jgi:hypothetical protein
MVASFLDSGLGVWLPHSSRAFCGRMGSSDGRQYSQALTLSCCPLGFDLYYSFFAGGVVNEAAPRPAFGLGHKPAFDWIAVDITQLLDALGFGPDGEVVVTHLPEARIRGWTQFAGCDLLEHLDD